MFNKALLILAFTLSWLSVLFIKKEIVKRYMPVAIFSALIVTMVFEIAYTYQWWKLNTVIINWDSITNVWFVFGPFLVGTLWIFHLTYKRFWLYILTNVLIDGLHMMLIDRWVQARGIYQLINITRWQVFLLMVSISVIIYIYQLWQEGLLKPIQLESDEKALEFRIPILPRKEKIK